MVDSNEGGSKDGWGEGEGWGQIEGEGVVLLGCHHLWVVIVSHVHWLLAGRGLSCLWVFIMHRWCIIVYGRGIVICGGS